MASKFKTDNLQLNNWVGSDRPTRSDFVMDNSIIDSVLGSHVQSESMHLTSDEKQRVGSPYYFKIVQGTDEESRTITFDFEPQMVLMFPSDSPPVELVDGNLRINCCIAVRNYGSTRNCYISSSGFKVFQKTEGSIISNFNNSDYQYVIVAFR